MPIVSKSNASRKAGKAALKATTSARKPAAVTAAKPSTPAKPAVSPVTGARAERVAHVAASLPMLNKLYDGASPAVHPSGRAGKRAVYAERVSHPKQALGDSGPTERDNSFLAMLAKHADKAGHFDPVSLVCDLGCISRAASGGFVTYSKASDTFTLTTDGATRGRNAAKAA